MKKYCTHFLIFLVALCFICSMATACNTHKHDFSVQKISEEYFNEYANYKQGMTYFYSCECGAKGETTFEFGEKLPCPSHNPKWIITEQPSCIKVGQKQYSCETCGEVFDTQIVSKSSHDFVDYKCSVCGKSSLVVGLDFEKSDFDDYYIVTGLGMTSDYNIVIPETYNNMPVKAISAKAFEKSRITSLVMPNSIEWIGENAFSQCSMLKSITLSKSLTEIKTGTFADCTALESVSVPEGVVKIEQFAFSNCTAVKSVTLPNTLTEIGIGSLPYGENLTFNKKDNVNYLGNAFNPYLYAYNASKTDITSVSIQNGCRFIGFGAFYNCNKLKNIQLPDTLTLIFANAFSNCTALTQINIPNSAHEIQESAFANCSSLTSVIFGEKVATIAENAFSNCNKLSTLTINKGLKTIGNNAFINCQSLNKVNYLGGVNDWVKIDFINPASNPITYSQKLYIDNTLLTNASILSEKVNDYAFYNCSQLTSVTFKEGTKQIGNYAFYNCTNINSITFANSITEIYDFAFYNCNKITTISLTGDIKSIGENAFENCASLESVVLGEKLEFIKSMAFRNCLQLDSFKLLNTFGWYYTLDMLAYKDKKGGEKIDLSDPLVNAIYFSISFTNEYFYKK